MELLFVDVSLLDSEVLLYLAMTLNIVGAA